MKSGLEGRNNLAYRDAKRDYGTAVSMKSGLEGRNNPPSGPSIHCPQYVSMKSGLEGRNNILLKTCPFGT